MVELTAKEKSMPKLAAKDSSQQWWLADAFPAKKGDQQVEKTVKVMEMAMHAREGGGIGGFWPWPREKRKMELRVAATVVD